MKRKLNLFLLILSVFCIAEATKKHKPKSKKQKIEMPITVSRPTIELPKNTTGEEEMEENYFKENEEELKSHEGIATMLKKSPKLTREKTSALIADTIIIEELNNRRKSQ